MKYSACLLYHPPYSAAIGWVEAECLKRAAKKLSLEPPTNSRSPLTISGRLFFVVFSEIDDTSSSMGEISSIEQIIELAERKKQIWDQQAKTEEY